MKKLEILLAGWLACSAIGGIAIQDNDKKDAQRYLFNQKINHYVNNTFSGSLGIVFGSTLVLPLYYRKKEIISL